MPITFGCPSCQKTLRVGDELAGQTCRCPNCLCVLQVPLAVGQVLASELPQAVPELPPPLPASTPRPARHQRFRRKRGAEGSRLGLWIGLCGAAAALLILGIGIYFIVHSGTAIEDEIRFFPDEFDSVYSINFDAIRKSGVHQKVSKEVPDILEREYEDELTEPFGLKFDDISRVTLARRGEQLVRVFRLKSRIDAEELQDKSKEVRYRKVAAGGRAVFIPEVFGHLDGFYVEGNLLVLARPGLLRQIVERNRSPRFVGTMSRAMRDADFSQGAACVEYFTVDMAPARFRSRRRIEAEGYCVTVSRFRSDELAVDLTCRCPTPDIAREMCDLLDEEVRVKAVLGGRERIEAERFSFAASGSKVIGKAAFSVKDLIDMSQ